MKRIIVLLLLLLPIGVFSQEIKIAYVNTGEVFNMMPEYEEAELKYASTSEMYQKEYKDLQDQLNIKMEEFQKIEATLNENIKVRKQQELQEMYDKIQNYVQLAQQELPQEREKLLAPVQEKLINAIKEVGDEQGYTGIFDVQTMLFVGKSAIDATPLVKAKLGLK